MVTQRGSNVGVCGVRGNFDDAQSGVKQIFSEPEINARVEKSHFRFSSANSINWGRLAPQVAYYFSAYEEMVLAGKIGRGERILICVPTGNFGNILAAYYAIRCGLPVSRLICASNLNKVLTDFIRTGRYDRRREFFKTAGSIGAALGGLAVNPARAYSRPSNLRITDIRGCTIASNYDYPIIRIYTNRGLMAWEKFGIWDTWEKRLCSSLC
jgi:hypothetical protein